MMMSASHDAQIDRIRDWIAQLMAVHSLTASELAREAGLSESTLTRLMNQDGPANLPREGTLLKIEQRFQTRRPTAPPASAETWQEGDTAARRLAEIASRLNRAEASQAYIVSDHALDLAGYLPDDFVLVDDRRHPEPGDVVAIRFLASSSRIGAVSLRIFDQPFLTAHTTDEALRRPLLIDPARIQIVGVVTAAVRQRAG